jgi:hypothetical protein
MQDTPIIHLVSIYAIKKRNHFNWKYPLNKISTAPQYGLYARNI